MKERWKDREPAIYDGQHKTILAYTVVVDMPEYAEIVVGIREAADERR